MSANCFQFVLLVSHLGCPRLSGTFIKASYSIITMAMWSEVRASNWLQSAMAATSGEYGMIEGRPIDSGGYFGSI